GDVAGGANAEIDELLGQIQDAFTMPFYDLYTKQKQRISRLAIIVSGKFTDNAIEKICEKIESHAVRNNVVFIDGDKLKTLAERFGGGGITSRSKRRRKERRAERHRVMPTRLWLPIRDGDPRRKREQRGS